MRLDFDTRDYSLKLSLSINRKISKKHKLKAGVIFDRSFNNSFMGWFSDTLYSRYNDSSDPDYMNLEYEHEYVNDKYNASTIQSYLNWNFRLSEKFSLNAGFHFLQFYLNKNYSAEPRIGINGISFS